VFDFDNALKFQRIDMCTNEIYVYTEFGHPFGYPWFVHEFCLIGSLSGTGGESAHLFTYDGHGLSDKLLTNSDVNRGVRPRKSNAMADQDFQRLTKKYHRQNIPL
jgi:hypothetical protein